MIDMKSALSKSLVILLLLPTISGTLVAEKSASTSVSEVVSFEDLETADAPDVIFSNLERTPNDRYNSAVSFPVEGKDAIGQTETSDAILIIPKRDVRAKVLLVALGYVSGTKRVNVGVYSDNEFTRTVGDPLPGGQGVITKMPDDGDCCRLAKVTLPGEGVLLSAGVSYWLAITPDDVNAPSFHGEWHLSNLSAYAGLLPPDPWRSQAGQWPAAQIRGTKVASSEPVKVAKPEQRSSQASAPSGNITIFTNLGPTSDNPYNSYQSSYVAGKNARDSDELWFAIPFIPRADVHAKILAAAITYISGTKLINLGIYNDNNGVPGSPLPGGQGSTTEIAEAGDLTRVTLPDPGVALKKGVRFWLVASPDNALAPDFEGGWHDSNLAVGAYEQPQNFISWTSFTAVWKAASIEGTSP